MQSLVALAAAALIVLLGAMMNAPTPPAEVVPEPPAPVVAIAPTPAPTPAADNAPSGG
jgi:hypothetical protein